MSQGDSQVTIHSLNAETKIVITSWTRSIPYIPLSFK